MAPELRLTVLQFLVDISLIAVVEINLMSICVNDSADCFTHKKSLNDTVFDDWQKHLLSCEFHANGSRQRTSCLTGDLK